jgi:hypothetical protein
MSNWDDLAVKVCKDRGLELLSLVSEGWYFYVKNSEGRVFPLPEHKLAAWVQEAQAKEKAEE